MGFLKALLLVASVAFGQQPAPQGLIGAPYRDFSGGYNDTVAPSNLQPNQSPNLLNVKIDDPAGSLKPREGYLSCGITPSGLKPTALYEYSSNSSGGVPRFIVTDSSTVWQTQDCVSFTTVTERLNGGVLPSFATVRDKLWIVDRTTHVITWNGSVEKQLDGTVSTPNPAPPRANYIEFWNERVWMARTSANPSGVYFSDLTDTLGNDMDPSTGTVAWPADNVIQVAQENGSPIYGIKVYRNALFVFKDNGIWRIDFNGPFDITVSKTLSSAGTRYQSSIVEMDNLLYFFGRDGFYAFDGDRAVRVSDDFRNKFDSISQNQSNTASNVWDTQADFELGTSSRTDTVSNSGSVAVSTYPATILNGDFESNDLTGWTCLPYPSASTTTACGTHTGPSPMVLLEGSYSAKCVTNQAGGALNDATISVFSVAGTTVASASACGTNLSGTTYYFDASSFSGTSVFLHFKIRDGGGNGSDLYSSSFTARTRITYQCAESVYAGGQGYTGIDNIQTFAYFSSGTHTSEIFNTVDISSWSTFEADSTLNGGTISYEIKVGSNTGAIAARAWSSISPGSLISGTSDQIYVQWRALLTATADNISSPYLDSVIINYIQGDGSAQSIYSYARNGNLYVSASTGTDGFNNIVFVKSKSPLNSWTLYDWKVGPMVTFNDRFYAGSSVDSKVYRMNYGTNDNGSAIPWYWQSRDETYGLPNIRKYLMEINLDYRKGTETALTAGYSRDEGSTYTSRSVSASGTGRGTSRLFMAGSNSTDYRFKVSGSTLDGTVTVLGLTGWARPAVLRE